MAGVPPAVVSGCLQTFSGISLRFVRRVLPYPTGAPIGAISAPNQQAAKALEPLT